MAGRRVRGEQKTKRPVDTPAQVAIQSIQRTNDQMLNRFSQLFREYDLTPSQYNLLGILCSAGQPMSTHEIARRMDQGQSGMSGILGRLEKQGLITRQRGMSDQRIIYVEPSKSAGEVLKRLDVPVSELHQQLIGHLTREELKELVRLLEKARVVTEQP